VEDAVTAQRRHEINDDGGGGGGGGGGSVTSGGGSNGAFACAAAARLTAAPATTPTSPQARRAERGGGGGVGGGRCSRGRTLRGEGGGDGRPSRRRVDRAGSMVPPLAAQPTAPAPARTPNAPSLSSLSLGSAVEWLWNGCGMAPSSLGSGARVSHSTAASSPSARPRVAAAPIVTRMSSGSGTRVSHSTAATAAFSRAATLRTVA